MKLAKALLLPYLKRFWLMFLSIILVGAFGCGILIGLRNAYHSLDENVSSLIDECGYPDLYVQTLTQIDNAYLSYLPKDFDEYMGIEKSEYRATYTTTFSNEEESFTGRIISYNDESILNQHVIDGEMTNNSIRMEYYFAKANGFKVGDKLSIKFPDGKFVDTVIDCTIVCPEASVVKADPYSISSSRDFALIYVPKDLIIEHSSKAYFNEMLFTFKEGEEKSLDETIDALKAYIKKKQGIEITEAMVKQLKSNVAFATTKENAEAIKFYHDAVTTIDMITIAAPIVFFVVVLIVTALFLSQIVKQCRKDIGVLRALGERKSSISSLFLSLGFITGVLSWGIGLGIGSLFTLIANIAYGEALKLFPQPFVMHPAAMFIALGAIMFVTLFTSLLISLNIARIKPVEALKALPPSKNETPLLTRTVFKHAPITLKVTISQTLRNISRYLLSGLCLLASGMLIYVALSLNASKEEMMNQLFSTRLNYDIQVYFDNMPSDAYIDEMFPSSDSNIKAKTLIKYLPSEMVNTRNDKKNTGLISGVKTDQNLLQIVDENNEIIPIVEDGIILSTYHAKLLEAEVGDVIKANDIKLTVKAISNEYLYQVSYTNFDGYEPSYSRGCLLVQVFDNETFFNKYKDSEHVTFISYTSIIHGEYDDRLAAFTISSYILTNVAILVGFLIVFNMMQTNLKEQKRTLATMRTLGYQRRSISMANLINSFTQYIFAMVLAIPIGILLAKAMLKSISVADTIYPFSKSWTIYVLTLGIVLLFLLVSHFLVMSRMRRWNLPESVKERE